jgi:hypothetical protein
VLVGERERGRQRVRCVGVVIVLVNIRFVSVQTNSLKTQINLNYI